MRTDKERKNEVSEIDAKRDEPNEATTSVIAEGNRITEDQTVKGCHDIDELRKLLDV